MLFVPIATIALLQFNFCPTLIFYAASSYVFVIASGRVGTGVQYTKYISRIP